jgi:nitroreductase
MNVIDAVHHRRSVRDYTSEPVDKAVLRRLIEAAVWAPSAINEQPWHFMVLQDQNRLDAISRQAKAHLLAAPAGSTPSHLREMLENPDFQIFYHAPVLIVVSAVRGGPWAIEDCALAAQNLMLAASAEGLGSCWIGFAQSWLQTPEGKKALEVPAESLPVAPIIVGHPASTPEPVPRKEPHIRWLS